MLSVQRSSAIPLLAANPTTPYHAVIFHSFCWQSNSSLPAQQPSSTPTAGGQTHPSLPSGHPPTLLAANLRTSLPSGHLPPLLLAVNFTSPPGYIGVSREER